MMLDYEKKRKLELMMELMELEQRERMYRGYQPNRDEWGRFAPREEGMTSFESILDEYEDPHYQWQWTSENTYELRKGLTGLERFLLGGIGLIVLGHIIF